MILDVAFIGAVLRQAHQSSLAEERSPDWDGYTAGYSDRDYRPYGSNEARQAYAEGYRRGQVARLESQARREGYLAGLFKLFD